jgi:hypothetical protein
LETPIGSYRVLKKSANAIVKTYGKVFGPKSLAASAPDCVANSMRTSLIRSSNAYSKGWMDYLLVIAHRLGFRVTPGSAYTALISTTMGPSRSWSM